MYSNQHLTNIAAIATAIATAHGFTVATRDTSPFEAAKVPVINPWESEK